MSASPPIINMGNKKQVHFFERVRIREIRKPPSEEFSLSDDSYGNIDSHSECEYHMDLEGDTDFGDYHQTSLTEGRRILTGKHSSNNHIVDFSGKVYASSHHDSKFMLLPKMDRRWQSFSSSTSPSLSNRAESDNGDDENDIDDDELPVQPLSSSSLNSEMKGARSVLLSPGSNLGKIQEDDGSHYFRPHPSSVPAPPRRITSSESLAKFRASLPPLPEICSNDSMRSRRKVTSAPALNRFRFRSRKSTVSIAESRNATFGSSTSTSNNKPPSLPSRSQKLMDRINGSSSSDKRNVIARSSDKRYAVARSINSNSNSNIIIDTSTSSRDTCATSSSEDLTDIPDDDIKSEDETEEFSFPLHGITQSEEFCTTPTRRTRRRQKNFQKRGTGRGGNSPRNSPPHAHAHKTLGPLSEDFSIQQRETQSEEFFPSSPSTNRRSLLQRGMGSLRSLTKSPRSRRRKNDLPPVRPRRISSVRHLQIDDI